MRFYSLLIAFLWVYGYADAQTPVTHQINQSFSIDSIDSIEIVVNGNIAYRKSPAKLLLVETTIEVDNATSSIMAVLTRSPRYKLVAERVGNRLVLSSPKDNPSILIDRSAVSELVHYTVFLPRKLWHLAH